MAYCDICNKVIQEPEGYFLTTQEIATNEQCWTDYFKSLSKMTSRSYAELGKVLFMIVGNRTKSDTPWIVCNQCANMFYFDRRERREKAKHYRETGEPRSGFALCRVQQNGSDYVIENIDDDAMMAAMDMATAALAKLSPAASQPSLSKPSLLDRLKSKLK